MVGEWQDEARLVIGVPGLRGMHAQLLVGAGFRTPDSLTAVEPDILCARVLAFAVTATGQRILHEGHPPDMERIVGWRASAAAQKAA